MSLKSFHIVFALITTGLFIFLSAFYGKKFFDTNELFHLLISGICLLLALSGIYYNKSFIEKYKSISNL